MHRFPHSLNSLLAGGVPGRRGTPALGLTHSRSHDPCLWAHTHTLTLTPSLKAPPTHAQSQSHPGPPGCPWASRQRVFSRASSYPPASPPPPRCTMTSQSPLGREASRGRLRCHAGLPAHPLPLINTSQAGGPRPRLRSGKNPGGRHPDQKPRKNQPMSKACTNEGGGP